MNNIYTIGFTKKNAKTFFGLIKDNNIDLVIDIRLNNTSQLAGYSKFPDFPYFLKNLCNCEYLSDKQFSPDQETLNLYKSKKIVWDDYVERFNKLMEMRNIKKYIISKYTNLIESKNICFLCSEELPDFCHRRLIAEIFSSLFNNFDIKHL